MCNGGRCDAGRDAVGQWHLVDMKMKKSLNIRPPFQELLNYFQKISFGLESIFLLCHLMIFFKKGYILESKYGNVSLKK